MFLPRTRVQIETPSSGQLSAITFWSVPGNLAAIGASFGSREIGRVLSVFRKRIRSSFTSFATTVIQAHEELGA